MLRPRDRQCSGRRTRDTDDAAGAHQRQLRPARCVPALLDLEVGGAHRDHLIGRAVGDEQSLGPGAKREMRRRAGNAAARNHSPGMRIDARHALRAFARPHRIAIAYHVVHAGNRALRRCRAARDRKPPRAVIQAFSGVARAGLEQPDLETGGIRVDADLEPRAGAKRIVMLDDRASRLHKRFAAAIERRCANAHRCRRRGLWCAFTAP